MYNLKFKAPSTYILPKEGEMQVPGLIIANQTLLKELQLEKPLEQVKNVAHLKGIRGYSIAMPDIHWGYGFPIGGVAAMDVETGVISPGGVGYDINCGVRLAIVSEQYRSISQKNRKQLLRSIFQLIPSGVGKEQENFHGLSDSDYKNLVEKGARWSIEEGYGIDADIECMESHGLIEGADINLVSPSAKQRGKKQLGTIGSGNHFVEIGEIETIYLDEIASAWKIKKGEIYVLIHSGSRGFGHQICQDALNVFIKEGFAKDLPDRQLVAAPIQSIQGQNYFKAMAAAANFAFNNRQQILHSVRQAFSKVLNIDYEDVRLIYDVCHNIAKFEMHQVEGKEKKLCVHRKGATRALGPHHPELAPIYQKTGQPVLVPGDMGRASYLLVGQGNPLTWCSCCHGAGRAKSRSQSLKAWLGRDPVKHMEKQGIQLLAGSFQTIAEEMPDAYKDVSDVVAAVEEAGLAKIVARLKPSLVIKG